MKKPIRSQAKAMTNDTLLKQLNGFIVILLLVFIFLNPVPHVNTIADICFYLAAIAALYLIFKKQHDPILNPSLFPLFFLFFIWALFTSLFALDRPDSFHVLYSHYVKYMILYFLLINFISSKFRFEATAWSIVISETIFAVGALIYHYGILGHPISRRLGFKASAIDIIGFGMIIGIIISIHLFDHEENKRKKGLLLFSMAILTISALLTQSRGAFLSLVVAIFVLLFDRKKTKSAVVLLVFIGIIVVVSPLKNRLFSKNFFRDYQRTGLILYSLEIIKDNPLLGTGFSIDTFRDKTLIDHEKYMSRIPGKYAKVLYWWPHNMLLSIGIRTGVIGVIIFLLIFIKLTKMCVDIMGKKSDAYLEGWAYCMLSLLAMFFVNGMLQPVFIHFLETVFYILCAMITILWRASKGKQSSWA